MPELNRRKFLLASAGAGVGVLAGATALSWPELMRAADQRPLAIGSGIAVIVTLYGGNDGINTVIPHGDNAYHDARPELAYAPHEVLDIDGKLGLNPALTGLSAQWRDGHLAIVRGVGYPNPDHSHFRSMDIWQTASPAEPVNTGWVGRWLDATGDDPLRAVNIGAVLPPMAVGAKTTAAALSTTRTRSTTAQFGPLVHALGTPDAKDTPAMAAVCASYRAAQTADTAFHGVTAPAQKQTNSLAGQLEVISEAITSGAPTRLYMASLGGFDTHANERGTQQRLLQTFDAAVTPFLQKMAGDERGKGVVCVAYSEFGRRVHANASQGTDHGTAGPVFVAGVPVRGGFYGDEPSLTDLDNGDLKSTTDFRDVYYDVLAHTLGGADPAPSVGPGRRGIGMLA